MTPDAHFLITSMIPASRGPIDWSCMTSGQSNTGPLMDTAEASETTTAPRRSRRLQRVTKFFFNMYYVNYTDT